MSKQVKNPWSHWCFVLVNNVTVLLATHGFISKSKFWMLERIVFLLLKITEGAWTGNMELSTAQVPFNSGTIIWMHLVENLLGMVLISGFGGEDFITLTFNMPQPVYHCYVAAMMTLFWLRQWLIICTLRYSTWLAQKSVYRWFSHQNHL